MYFWDSMQYFKSESQRNLLTSTPDIDADAIFSLFVILAIYVEIESDGFESLDMPYELKVIDQILRIRMNLLSDIEIEVEFDGYGFNSKQKETIRKWLSHEINFVDG